MIGTTKLAVRVVRFRCNLYSGRGSSLGLRNRAPLNPDLLIVYDLVATGITSLGSAALQRTCIWQSTIALEAWA